MPFNTVLIANRGEIAVRLIKACKRLDLKAVAIYSDADRGAPFVKLADDAVHIGPAEAANSYLDMDRVIKAAEKSGAGAIHPGYGFLAENASFAEKCEKAGLVFIGPRPDIIKIMGSKIEAKAAAIEAGVPVVPGYHGADMSTGNLKRAANELGLPLMIKASAGGGGRGMRLVHDLDAFDAELELARQEASAAFGDPAILLERYVGDARHIEVQVLGDHHGNVVHLYERDCSIQRNNQKIIEEAPAPNLPEHVRDKILKAALSLCTRIGYDNAGTVEFIYEAAQEEFYFLEMNTRLQVEHPVTEAITGIDLVEWQIRVAMKEPLAFSQKDIECKGWAMEARIAAENPAEGYMPETGRVSLYEEPAGEGVRVDSGIEIGSEISHHYDSMLSKLIVSADSRLDALRRLKRALKMYKISGVKTNIPFLVDVLNIDAFEGGLHHTNALQKEFPNGWQAPEIALKSLAEAALAGFLGRVPAAPFGPWHSLGAWRITGRSNSSSKAYLTLRLIADKDWSVCISGSGGTYDVSLDGEVVLNVSKASLEKDVLTYETDGRFVTSNIHQAGQRLCHVSAAQSFEAELLTSEQVYLAKKEKSHGGGNQIISPMPGLVVDILAQEGQQVAAGETLVILEAMKLMQTLVAPTSGTVSKIHYSIGDTPEKGAILVTIDPEQTAA